MAIASQMVTFAGDRASVSLPDTFRASISGAGLIATFGAKSDHTVELSLLGVLPNEGGAKTRAIGFIQSQAKKREVSASGAGVRAAQLNR